MIRDVGNLLKIFFDTCSAPVKRLPMPRGPRLDAPDTLHHGMARGIERRRLFLDAADCEEFV